MNIRNLNKFWWIFEMVVTCGFKHGPKVVASSYKWDLWYRIELIIQHWIKMNVFRLNAIAESHIQFWNSSELIKILVYFITLCHGWPCSGNDTKNSFFGIKSCLTVLRSLDFTSEPIPIIVIIRMISDHPALRIRNHYFTKMYWPRRVRIVKNLRR